ncbi:hypothetical protein FA15DRAFT_651042 [Coprinopsis marcescibilis]|uniref:TECPR1-like DysF domain-containing protein n=1 Tax=Coprinopsis marcescibilis TaxID=230819 RepID=A0A5C3LDB3_COPMA|nr:hypothetical protein FA15DRAFT_651042 [Coprinopsis marcescibilis]
MSKAVVASPVSISQFPQSVSEVPEPNSLVLDNTNVADPVRRRFAPKKSSALSISRLWRSSPKSINSGSDDATVQEPTAQTRLAEVQDTIRLDSAASLLQPANRQDHYEWAVVYENQRGITLFSTPYYSNLSLLPWDPSPFTLPNASKRRSHQPPISLDRYTLPDGTWKWVSRCWMIDMRTDSGEVQHDGFEYNWMFRRHHWRAEVGAMSAGGWVRRRRWIRLMVRPGKERHEDNELLHPHGSDDASSALSKGNRRQSGASSIPLSIISGSSDATTSRWNDMNPDEVWIGDTVDADWERCRVFMKRFGRDGRKLEVWRLWFGYYHPQHKDEFTILDGSGKRHEKQWTEDEGPLPSEIAALELFSQESVALAPRDHLIPVLRKYGHRILRSFIYPDSRAEFIKLLALGGLLQELDIPYGKGKALESTELDFWSYANALEGNPTPPLPVK